MSRSWLDRAFQRGAPRVVAGYAPPPRALADGLFVLDRRLRMPGGAILPTRTTLVRLADGRLVVISPPPVAPGGVEEIRALGAPSWVVAPNSFHYLYVREFLARHPEAVLCAAPGLTDRVPALGPAVDLGREVPEAWSGELDLAVFGPVRGVSEVFFFHAASGSLVVTDLAFHMPRIAGLRDRLFWRLSGVPARFGPSRTARMLLLRDDAVAGRFFAGVARWPMRRIVVAHGELIEEDAALRFRDGFARYLEGGSSA